MVTTIITAMAAYSNERVAAIVLSVLYRMLTFIGCLRLIFLFNEYSERKERLPKHIKAVVLFYSLNIPILFRQN